MTMKEFAKSYTLMLCNRYLEETCDYILSEYKEQEEFKYCVICLDKLGSLVHHLQNDANYYDYLSEERAVEVIESKDQYKKGSEIVDYLYKKAFG